MLAATPNKLVLDFLTRGGLTDGPAADAIAPTGYI